LEDGKPYALWVGKKNSEFDSLFILPESLIKCEVKTVENVSKMIALTGKSKDSFESEKKKALPGEFNITNKKSYFLFVTNAKVTRKNRAKTLGKKSMLISFYEWDRCFSGVFSFFKPKNDDSKKGEELPMLEEKESESEAKEQGSEPPFLQKKKE